MPTGDADFPDLVKLTLRAERAGRQNADLLQENARLRAMAVDQLRHMFAIGAEFLPSGRIAYPGALSSGFLGDDPDVDSLSSR